MVSYLHKYTIYIVLNVIDMYLIKNSIDQSGRYVITSVDLIIS